MQPSASVDALSLCVIHRAESDSTNIFSSRDSVSSTSDSTATTFESDRVVQLERELIAARNSIAEKEAKCSRLTELQTSVDSEVQELTEKLFQEAYKMVNEAESRRAKAEKLLAESHLKVDVLTAEVEALKSIVKSPVLEIHMHSQAASSRNGLTSRILGSTPNRKSSRKNHTLPLTSKDGATTQQTEQQQQQQQQHQRETTVREIDPIYHREFIQWREDGAPISDNQSRFLSRIFNEDVHLCLNFSNSELTKKVFAAIKANTLELEAVSEAKPLIRTCALSAVPRLCPYRMRIDGDDTEWYYISLLARNRIAAVCDFFTYIRYVNQGIVKTGINESYWDIIGLRRNMTLARLGYGFSPRIGGFRAGCI